jgi:hypothetical protein
VPPLVQLYGTSYAPQKKTELDAIAILVAIHDRLQISEPLQFAATYCKMNSICYA